MRPPLKNRRPLGAESDNTLRHSFATHVIEGGYDSCAIQELLGHEDVKTTMIHAHDLEG